MRKFKSKFIKGGNDYKQQNPNLEFVNVNDQYGVTVNCAERFPSLLVEYNHYLYMIKKYMVKYFDQLSIYPELSATGKLHFHGHVKFESYKSILCWYRKDPIDGLNVKLEVLTDEDGWNEYVTKQSAFHKYLCANVLKGLTLPVHIDDIRKHKTDALTVREQFKGVLY